MEHVACQRGQALHHGWGIRGPPCTPHTFMTTGRPRMDPPFFSLPSLGGLPAWCDDEILCIVSARPLPSSTSAMAPYTTFAQIMGSNKRCKAAGRTMVHRKLSTALYFVRKEPFRRICLVQRWELHDARMWRV